MPNYFYPNKTFAVIALALTIACGITHAATEPYTVEILANVLFGEDGKPREVTMIDEAIYPAAFVDNVKVRIAKTKIGPPLEDGKPATLRTGMTMKFLVTPGEAGGQVKLTGLAIGPLPVKKFYANFPKDVRGKDDWDGAVEGICTVGTDGKCKTIEVKALPGMPESVRRYAKASLDGWVFLPQELNGKPIEGEYKMNLSMHTHKTSPEDFRQDYFQRLERSR